MNKLFQERLQEAIKRSGLSQSEVAKRSGISRGSITDYIKGRYEAKQDKVYDLAKVLGVRSEWLMGYNVDPVKPAKSVNIKEIPVVSQVSAGPPLYAEENIIDHTYVAESLLKDGKEYFGLIVDGDSMDKEFRPGDIVIIEKGSCIENGQVGVVQVNGYNATLKRVKYVNDSLLLLPESNNPAHEPQVYNNNDEVTIIGRVVGLNRKY
jgi:repressor LexA